MTLRRVGDNPMLISMYHVPAATHADNGALNVLAVILGDNPSGRLYKSLVDNKKAVAEDTDMEDMHDAGFFMATAILQADQSLDDAKQAVLKTVEGFATEPPSQDELERAKNRILKQIDLNLTNSQNIGLTLSEYAAVGDWRMMYYQRDAIKKVTVDDVVRVAKAYLKESNRTVGEFIPTKHPDRAEIPATPDASAVLKDFKGGATMSQGESFTPTPANIESRVQRFTLPNGMKVVLLPKQTRGGTVVVQGSLHFGTEQSLNGKFPASQMAGALLMRGTKNKTRQQIQDEADKLKSRLTIGGTVTGANLAIETVDTGLAGSLKLAAECLRESTLPDSEFEQARQLRIAGIENGRSEPTVLAQIEIQRHLNPYPRGDVRYTGTPEEQIEDFKKVTAAQARDFYAKFYGASDAELVISGQFNPAEVKTAATELFGDWKSPSPYVRVSTHYQKIDAMDRKIETPDKQNAFFMSALMTKMTDDDPDYAAMILANYMLGGSGASRMFKRIRDKEGLSYGVNSNFAAPPKDDGAIFSSSAISNPQNAPKVEASYKDELARTLKDGFTAQEVAEARKSLLEERMVGRSTDQSLAGTLAARERWGRTMKWDEALEAKIAALTPEEVSAAFRRHIDPASLSIVKAGDFKKAGVLQ